MHRPAILTVAVAALVAAVSLSWVEVRQEREFRRLIAAGDRALARDATVEAVEAYSGAVVLRADSMLAYLKRGDTYRRTGDLAAATRDLRRAAALDPTAPRPIELLGDVYSAMRQDDAAVAAYGQYLELDDRAPAVLYKLGLAHYRAGRLDAAAEALHRALAIDDRLAAAHYALGMVYRRQRRVDEAIRSFTRALAIDASFAAARQELAELLGDIGRPGDGLEQLEALAALEPRRPERLVSVGLAFVRLNRFETAILTLSRAAERHPGSPIVQTALGEAWLAMAESGTDIDVSAVRKAIAALQAVANRPEASGPTLMLYGRALLMTDDPRAAERALQLAVTRLPVDPAAFLYLADAAGRLGHQAVAEQARQRYLRLTT